MGIRNYSPTEIKILLGGFYEATGFVQGSFVTISKDIMPYKTKRTSDGRVARTYINDQTYTLTLKLASTSPTNDVLTKIFEADQLTQLAKFPIFVKDTLGSSLFLSPTSWISEVPDLNYSDTITERTWVIQCTQCLTNFGGNNDTSTDLQDTVNIITASIPSLTEILG